MAALTSGDDGGGGRFGTWRVVKTRIAVESFESGRRRGEVVAAVAEACAFGCVELRRVMKR